MKKQILNVRGAKSLALSGLASLMALGALTTSTAEAAVAGYYDYAPAWTQAANACTIDDGSQANHALGHTGLGFKPGSAALSLTAWCNVTNPLDTGNPDGLNNRPLWNGLIAGYTDPDGIGTNASVKAYLMRLNRTNGLSSTIAYFDSNAWYNSTTWQEGLKTFNTTLDFAKNEYYVMIYLTRTSTQYNPTIGKLRIAPVIQIPR